METEMRSSQSASRREAPAVDFEREEILNTVRETLNLEAAAVQNLANNLDDSFNDALQLLATCNGKVILTGVGKSGLIAKKIAATLTSTGRLATFLHPADGMHGDLGVVSEEDVVIALGKSGESEELTALLPAVRRIGAKIIAITACPDSRLARAAEVALITPVEREACPLNLAPTVSTTLALAVGDALAVALMKMRNFRSEDFARFHPGGKLGKRLLLRVADVMVPLNKCAVLDAEHSTMEEILMGLSKCGLGLVLFTEEEALAGILTDGDIRRFIQVHRSAFFDLRPRDVINRSPFTVRSDVMAVDALSFMEERERPLNVVPIVDENRPLGVVRLHDLLTVS